MATTRIIFERGDHKRIAHITGTWTGNSSETFTPTGNFQLLNITINYDASITNDATVTLDNQTGVNYDTLLKTIEQASGVTDIWEIFDKETIFASGNSVVIACDVGANNAFVTLTVMEHTVS